MSRRAWQWWLLVLGLLCLTMLALPVLRLSGGSAGLFPVEVVRVRGIGPRLSTDQVVGAALPALSAGWIAADPREVRSRVAKLPWVARAEVRKVWPNAIEIDVVERDAVARWGEQDVINSKAEVFAIDAAIEAQELPRFDGPLEKRRELLDFYRHAEATLAPFGLAVLAIDYRQPGGLHVRLSNGLDVLLGRNGFEGRWQRFLLTWPRLAGQSRLAQIDLRYPHGLAVQSDPATAALAVRESSSSGAMR